MAVEAFGELKAMGEDVGYSDLAKLVTAIEHRHLTLENPNPQQRPEATTDTTDTAAQLATV